MKCCNHDCNQGDDCPDFCPATWAGPLRGLLGLFAYLILAAALIGCAWLMTWAIWSLR